MTLSTKAPEKGTYVINAAFYDEDDNEVVPNSASWTLTDRQGNIINGREDVSITGLSTSVDVVLSGDDLKIIHGQDEEERFFLVKYSYDSSLGSGLESYDEVSFLVKNFKAL